ncbi:MAG: hypothetical protein GXP55_20065, partial [Deltaproteobacteria bacterium]|nr:hypothetical protein [Deltaproteobacteria bacterium]
LPGASRAPADLPAAPTNLPPPPDAERAPDTHEAALMDTAAPPTPTPPVDDEPVQGDGDGPEEAPFAIPQVESRVEREMSFAEKAGQTRIMVTRVRQRAERVEARLAEARQSGDADDVHLQEMLLMRLQRRTQQLTQQAAYEQEQATDEAQQPDEQSAGDQPPEQATSDAP